MKLTKFLKLRKFLSCLQRNVCKTKRRKIKTFRLLPFSFCLQNYLLKYIDFSLYRALK
jgi:hypothetical protein